MVSEIPAAVLQTLRTGAVIPACPLALTQAREIDEHRQRALVRYYLAAGAGGLAVGVHTTQFQIREAGLYEPVLRLAADELKQSAQGVIRIAGICGGPAQARKEATLARACGYHAGLLSLSALKNATEDELIAHSRQIAEVIPVIGFYLQPAVGGLLLPYSFWRRWAEIEGVIAVKIAAFNRYQTIDVVRAIVESGRDDIALYTGNDDHIILDLLTPFRFGAAGTERRIAGGLLGQWAVWTRKAVELLRSCRALADHGQPAPAEMLRLNNQLTDANSAIFDAAHNYAGCIPGIHEVLRRQGLLAGTWCLDPHEQLSPGQSAEIDRVCRAYPDLTDDAFVAGHLEEWLR